MALALDVLAGRFALLSAEPDLLLPDPRELRDGEHTNRVESHPLRRRDAHPARWRVHAEVDVLDVLQHHVHRDFAKPDLLDLNTHVVP